MGKKSNEERDALISDLSEKLREVDLEGLQFLAKQADVLIYNAKVDEVNKRIRRSVRPKVFSGPQVDKDDEVAIERTKDGFFYIAAAGQRVFFNLEEMRSLTRIAHAADSAEDGAARLYRWFGRERKDFLNDTDISTPKNDILKQLHGFIVATYKVKRS